METGFFDLSDESLFDWAWLVQPKVKKVRVLLTDPAAWVQRDWPRLLDAASTASVTIDVYLVDPTDPDLIKKAAGCLRTDVDALRIALQQAKDHTQSSWQAQRASATKKLHRRSSLSIRALDDPGEHAIVQCDDRVALLFDPVRIDGVRTPRLVGALGEAHGHSKWHQYLADLWEKLESGKSVPLWTDREPANDSTRPGSLLLEPKAVVK